jgi:predicted GIY-YIG superfamily endonuclease
MARWTTWASLYSTDGSNLKPSEIPYEGPGAYKFAASRGRGEKHTLYVGHTGDLNGRLYTHSHGDDTTWKALDKLSDNGYKIFYSVHTTHTVWQAQRLEQNCQKEWWLYPLNILGNPTKKRTG